MLTWSRENPVQLLESTGRNWAALEVVNAPHVISNDDYPAKRFSVNRAGIAFSYIHRSLRSTEGCLPGADGEDVELDRTSRFSTDLTNWWTIEGLDD